MKNEILRLEHISVKKAGKLILNDLSINVYEDEFLFLYGFSDSGTRELGEILSGTRKPDSGRILISDRPANNSAYGNPGGNGFYIIQNRNNLVEIFTIAENLFFGGKKKYYQTVVPKKKQELMAKRVVEEFDFDIDVRRKAGNLTYFQEIMIKIIMAYVRGAKLVIFNELYNFDGMDEEKQVLKKAIQKLRDDGISVLWINQRMNDIKDMADRIIVMEDGKNTRTLYKGNTPEAETDKEEFIDKMMHFMDRDAVQTAGKQFIYNENEIVFSMKGIYSKRLNDFSMDVHKGEMISIATTDNLKIHEFRRILVGEEQGYIGQMTLNHKSYHPSDYMDAVKNGVGFLDLMWYEQHCIPNMKVADNILIDSDWKRNRLFGIVNKDKRKHMMNLYKMNHPGWPTDYFRSLSADQQKVVLLDKLIFEPYRLVIIIQPFSQLHGLMKGTFQNLLGDIKKTNGAVLLLSAGDPLCDEVSDRSIIL